MSGSIGGVSSSSGSSRTQKTERHDNGGKSVDAAAEAARKAREEAQQARLAEAARPTKDQFTAGATQRNLVKLDGGASAVAQPQPVAAPQATANAPAVSPQDAFILQFTHERWNPTGPNSSTNCGPASLAMSMAYTGHMPPGLSKEQQVDHARALMHPELAGTGAFTLVKDANGRDVPTLSRDQEKTSGNMETNGIAAAGGTPSFGRGWEELDRALEKGPVLGNGYLGPEWRKQFPERVGRGDIGHVNAILGKTAEGKYIVADPMHTGGPVEMTREQLSKFFPNSNGVPTFAATGLGNNAPTTPTTPTTPSQPGAVSAPPAGLRYDGGQKYNAQVEQLQNALVKAGYMKPEDAAKGPGFYGNRTRAAVEQLQKDFGISSDGKTYGPQTKAALERALAGERPGAATGTPPAGPGTGGTAPQYTFNARQFPGFYDASKDKDAVYNIEKIAKDAPKMWAEYGDVFKKVGKELGVDPQAMAAYCCFESYHSGRGTFNPNAGARHGNMVAAGIAQTQAQNWAGKEVPGLSGVRFPDSIEGTAAMLKANPEYSIRCLATIMKGQYDKNGQDLAKSFPLTAYPAWGDPSRRRGAYGDQATYVSRAFVLYNAFRQADGLPPG
jgi:hypothetical protein